MEVGQWVMGFASEGEVR
jgi:hypothetical protein